MVEAGDDRGGLLAGVSEKLIRALPPAFLVLVLLNIGFMGVSAYVFQHNTEVRNAMLTRIIESCLTRQSKP
jgi:hypothetical protein